MSKLKITKVTADEIKVLYNGAYLYFVRLQDELKPQLTISYMDDVLRMCIAKRLYLKFRQKLEGDSTKYSLSLLPSEGVVLLYICQHIINNNNDEYNINVADKNKNILDQQLKSL